ncbi:MAG: GDSL-type esterase/lipase family protein [Bacteroidales bacterium]
MLAKLYSTIRYALAGFLTLLSIAVLHQETRSQTIKIQPLGNSITQASYPRYSYRYNLWTKLIDAGFDFDFVGSLQDNKNGNPDWPVYMGQSFDQDHEGHSGWTTFDIWWGKSNEPDAGRLSNWLQLYTPDVSLIHMGTNDINQAVTNGYISESFINTNLINYRYSRLIDTLRFYSPSVVIFIAQIIPRDDSARNYWTNYFNAQIPNIKVTKYNPNSPIIIVDQNTGFDMVADTYDGVHPNAAGEEKIAQKWRDAIIDYYCFNIDLVVYLEGAYDGAGMDAGLTQLIPLNQPFNSDPWNYNGEESVDSIPAGIVDWVLVELRDTLSVEDADETTVIQRKACFLNSSGQVMNLDGSPLVRFTTKIKDSLFVVVRHRNHLPVISAVPLVKNLGTYSYDFSASVSAYGGINAQKDLGNGIFGMIAGDMNGDGVIDSLDKTGIWDLEAGIFGYSHADLNFDGQVDNRDKVEFLEANLGFISQVP